MTPSEISKYWFEESFRWIAANPIDSLALVWKKAWVYWGAFEVPDNLDYYLYRETAPVLRLPLLGFGWVVPFGLLGMGLIWRRRGWPRVLLGFVALYSSSVIAFFVFSRFRMPMMPAMFVLASYAAVELFCRFRIAVKDRSARPAAAIPFCALIALMLVVNLPVRAHADSLAWRVATALKLPRQLETSAQGRFNLGVAYAARAKESTPARPFLELAEQQLRRSLETDDRFAISFVELAKVLARLERNAEALELYRQAAQIESTDPRIRHAIGLLHLRLGDAVAAEESFREALRVESRYVTSANRLGRLLLEQERFEEAEELFEYVLSFARSNAAARVGLEAARRGL